MEQATPSFLTNMIPIALILVIFYFTLIRPQQKQEKERKKMLASIDRGHKVLTAGGIIGMVTAVKGEDIDVKIAENVKVTVARSYIVSVLKDTADNPAPQTPS